MPPFASLEDSGWGGVMRGWAKTVAKDTMTVLRSGVNARTPAPSPAVNVRPRDASDATSPPPGVQNR